MADTGPVRSYFVTAPAPDAFPPSLAPLQFQAFEYRGQTGGGATAPHRVAARDPRGHSVDVVLKLREPGTPSGHHGATSLACELACSILARALGLSTPDYGVVHVGSIFAHGIANNAISGVMANNLGPNFGSVRIIPQPLTWNPNCSLLSDELRQAMDDVLSFDASVLNGDRGAANPNLLWDGAYVLNVIDHGLACPAHQWTDQEIAASPVFPDNRVQMHCGYTFLHGRGSTFADVPDRWVDLTVPGFWDGLRACIPPDWERAPGEVDRVFRFLHDRAARLATISQELRRVVR